MIKISTLCSKFFHLRNSIYVNYCAEKPYMPEEIRKLTRQSLPDIKLPMIEPFEPGRGPTQPRIPSKKELKYVRQNIKKGFREWIQELKEGWKHDPESFWEHGEIHKQWTFDKEKALKDFLYTDDTEQGFGYSSCTLTKTSMGTLLFKGNLSTSIRDDGETVRSGFCGFRTPRAMKSFNRKWFYNWGMYTHIVLKVRGDGRYYLINLGQDDEMDHTWYNMHSYFLFTRGGPYWQTVKIPFSKFVSTHKGKVQDRQPDIEPTRITFVGITLCDNINGPFQLEIEYIGTMYDMNHEEDSAYEEYDCTEPAFSN